jgi:NAD-dependent SIR2 family protein deacetylase
MISFTDEEGWPMQPPAPLPDDPRLIATLAEQNAHRALVLFIGAGVSRNAGLPTWEALLEPLRTTLNVDEKADGFDVAQWYSDREGRQALIGHVQAHIRQDNGPGALHRSLARLAAPVIFTTNYDQLMERALTESQGVPPDVIVEDAHIGLIDEARRTTVVKLHG